MSKTKVILHPVDIYAYKVAEAKPEKYSFIYRCGRKPLKVIWMEGNKDSLKIISWMEDGCALHYKNGFEWDDGYESEFDLFIEEKVIRTREEIEAEIAELQEELNQAGGGK
jgi:hypothetical protein